MPDEGRSWNEREALVEVSAAIAAREEGGLQRAFRLAAAVVTAGDVDEVILQAHLFVGYPLALEAFRLWREVSPIPARREESSTDWRRRGEEVCAAVYGSAYDKLLEAVDALHPDFGTLMLEVGYGRVIGRAQLDLATRELCVSALLAVWDTPRQLHSHLRGALNAGATPEDVRKALDVAGRRLRPEQLERVLAVWEMVQH